MKEKKWTIHIIMHTHWDREWFYSKQENEIYLNKNTKNLIKAVYEKGMHSYLYDNQSTLDDYLVFHPEDKKELNRLIEDHKLIMAPAYEQQDMYNTTSETTVRNIYYGKVETQCLNQTQKAAYYPDTFGFHNQLPQIFKKSGLDGFVFWRGVNDHQTKGNTFNRWMGIDGTEILSYNLHLGYWLLSTQFEQINASDTVNVDEQAKMILTNFASSLQELKKRTNNSGYNIAIPCGWDLSPVMPDIINLIETINKIDDENNWIISDYDTFFSAIKASETFNLNACHQIEGELRFGQYSRVHKTIGSQRYDIKAKFKEVEYQFYNQLEPLASYWSINGGDYHFNEMNVIIKKLIFNCGHDNLTGACSDYVNSDVLNRLLEIEKYIQSMVIMFMKMIADRMHIVNEDIVIFNSHYQKNAYTNIITVFSKHANFKLVDEQTKKTIPMFSVSSKKIIGGQSVKSSADGEVECKNNDYYLHQVLLINFQLPAYSSNVLKIIGQSDDISLNPTKKLTTVTAITTRRHQIKLNDDLKTLSFFDKKLNLNLPKWFEIKPNADAGDGYDYSPVFDKDDECFFDYTLSAFDFHQSEEFGVITLKYNYSLKYKDLDNDKQQLTAKQKFEVKIFIGNDDTIQFKIICVNENRLLRWTILFYTSIASQYSHANINYGEVDRPVILSENELWSKEKWKERPIEIENMESFCYLHDNKNYVGLITCGNNEYQIVGEKFDTIAMTMFRTPTALGKSNLMYRPGRASGSSEITLWTPEATLQKRLEFNFYFASCERNTMWSLSESRLTPLTYYQKQNYNVYFRILEKFMIVNDETDNAVPLINELFSIGGNDLILKAFKKHSKLDGYVIRIFNSKANDVELNFISQKMEIVKELDLMENVISQGDKTFHKYEIRTFLIKLK